MTIIYRVQHESQWNLSSGEYRENKEVPVYCRVPYTGKVQLCLGKDPALLEKCWRISLYVTDDAVAKLYCMCDETFRKIDGNCGKISPIELSNSVVS